eukprot:Ihof_evm1s982 gene=Ihof_evmTU1s982
MDLDFPTVQPPQDEMDPCSMCQRPIMWRYGEQGTCNECQSRIRPRLFTHNVAVPGLAPEPQCELIPCEVLANDDIPKPVLEGCVYAGNSLTRRALEQCAALGIYRILHVVDDGDNIEQALLAGFDYRPFRGANFSAFEVYDQLVEAVSVSKVQVAIYGVRNYSERRTGTLVLLAFL